jgi:uncharacterized protein (TIGR02265 family)
MTDKLVFATAVEGLYVKALAGRITPALKAALKSNGLDLDKPVPPALTRDAWYACLTQVVAHLYPTLPRDQAHRELGRLMTRGVSETFWGRAFAPAVRLLGAKRLLLRMPNQFKSTNNYAPGTTTDLGPTSVQLDVTDVGDAPCVLQGSLEELAQWAGASDVKVDVTFASPPRATYLITWGLS